MEPNVSMEAIDLDAISLNAYEDARDREDFLELLLTHLPVFYEDVDSSFGESIVQSHLLGYDPVGHFTRRKVIHRVFHHTTPIGYCVVTEKRGGSIKIGPTVLYEPWRGKGIGTRLRSLLSRHYAAKNFRKAYSTVADNKLDSYRYLVKSTYGVEAHLRFHYSTGHGELVFGKLLSRGAFEPGREPARERVHRARIVLGTKGYREPLRTLLLKGMSDSFSEVGDDFVDDLYRAEERGLRKFADKGKTIFVATNGGSVCGVAVTTAKRGGATKVAPLLAAEPEVAAGLIAEVGQYYRAYGSRKVYAIVPNHHNWLIRVMFESGYASEGLLREPYRRGVDMRVISEFLQHGRPDEKPVDIVLSILPDPVRRIFIRQKCFELRKMIPDKPFGGMYLYTTGGVSAFTGYVKVIGHFRLDLESLWNIVGENAAPRQRFDQYFERYSAGYAIPISEVCKFKRPIPIADIRRRIPGFSVPIQYVYLESDSELARLLEQARSEGEWFTTPVRKLIRGHERWLVSYESDRQVNS